MNDAVTRYVPFLRVDHYQLQASAEMVDARGSVQETHYVLASDYDSLARQVAGLRAENLELRAIVMANPANKLVEALQARVEAALAICNSHNSYDSGADVRSKVASALAGDQP